MDQKEISDGSSDLVENLPKTQVNKCDYRDICLVDFGRFGPICTNKKNLGGSSDIHRKFDFS